MGPGKLKSNPSYINTLDSKSMSYFLSTIYFSSGVRRFIILEKLGDIGCSILADKSTLMVAKWMI